MVVADLNGKGPRELLVTALVRARMAELLGPSFRMADRGSSLFLMGLFSVLDAILRRPLDEILSELNLEEDLSNALLGQGPRDHPVRRLLEFVTMYELGNWPLLSAAAEEAGVNLDGLSKGYIEALRWADAVARA
jgi:EAL and modified HD-GYP domain-containing signal transduction protein